jgi:hypothetical protein
LTSKNDDEHSKEENSGTKRPYAHALIRNHSASASNSVSFYPDTDKLIEVSSSIVYSYGRPDIAEHHRTSVEATGGETAVVVCAGRSLVAKIRNSVEHLSDERAVHIGTGAQRIFLHIEYSF